MMSVFLSILYYDGNTTIVRGMNYLCDMIEYFSENKKRVFKSNVRFCVCGNAIK